MSEKKRSDPRSTGQNAERYAAEHLRRVGYRIIATNVRYRVGEIDVVAEHSGTLVFVEVRARRAGPFGTAAETVGSQKQSRVLRAVETYLQEKGFDPARPCRIDVVAIQLDRFGQPAELEIIENAFSG